MDPIRTAHSVQVYVCDACKHVHVALQDEAGEALAQASLSPEAALEVAAKIAAAARGEPD